MSSLITYLKNVRAEMDHVVWPRPRTALMHVALIVLISVVAALLIAGLDYAFSHAIEQYISTH
ncbi:MAG: Protein translocase subunit SecE [Parcubacteria group bacterium]|nr:Protein translocase subunit SecE [Parcubacteria group bacterium]